MKNLLKTAVAVATLGVAAVSLSAQVKGSHHDFTVATGLDSAFRFQSASRSLCSTCHTIHFAITQDAPLWIHDTTTATFTLYSSATLGAVPNQPQNNTRACLSCHDGTVGVNAVNGSNVNVDTSNHNPIKITSGNALIGTDLSNDHPVSITYGVGKNLFPISQVTGAGFPLYGANKDQVECATCHDPHVQGSGIFLRTTPAAYSTRCIVCHNR